MDALSEFKTLGAKATLQRHAHREGASIAAVHAITDAVGASLGSSAQQ